ncbi:MAG TPA: NUDIX domain-containing protein [Streptosporangiaceae bacterium]|nr:NUDIX domain-containing protein [Streptosporangiaceae bacterium]
MEAVEAVLPRDPPAPTDAAAAAAVEYLAGWQPPDEEQRALRDLFVAHLRAHPDGLSRACRSGHITASAAVLDAPRRRVLLTLHGKIGRWLQLGGHCEPADTTLAAAALREACEESAITGLTLRGGPVNLDLHAVPCGLAAHPVTPADADRPTSMAGPAAVTGAPVAVTSRPRADRVGPLGPAGPAGWTWHLDVQFVAIAPAGAHPIRSDESDDLRWWPVGSLPASADDALRRLVARARAVSG